MAANVSFEILDLRHFAAPLLRPVLDAEATLWMERLHWDYRASSKLLMQYLDSHMLPGYAALESGQVTGYSFCVYEENKAVIGDVFALPGLSPEPAPPEVSTLGTAHEIEETLLRHLLETLLNSPQIDRIESQLLLHPAGSHAGIFRANDFQLFHRLFMVQPLEGRHIRPDLSVLPTGLELRPWRDEDLNGAARLISEAYRGHPDSCINDQYNSVHGSLRFLHNIVRYAGCGAFSAQTSHVVVDGATRELAGLVLGSRVSPQSGHITQLCVAQEHRRRGMARLLLDVAAMQFLRQGVSEISLTVTEANAEAINLYKSEGYQCRHTFDAAVWRR